MKMEAPEVQTVGNCQRFIFGGYFRKHMSDTQAYHTYHPAVCTARGYLDIKAFLEARAALERSTARSDPF